jgi:type IV pilus assembly protein PilN
MININLLPWRDKHKEQIQKQTVIALILSAFLGITVVFFLYIAKSGDLSQQLNRNKFLQGSVNHLNIKIADLKTATDEKDRLLKELTTIHNLVVNRSTIVDIFNSLVELTPKNIFFQKIVLISKEINIVGLSKFNNDISELMRNLDESTLFDEPSLTSVKKTQYHQEEWNEFNLKIRQL